MGTRKGGLNLDPAVTAFKKTAAQNKAALTQAQRRDQKRIRVKYDLLPELKGAIETEAQVVDTSASQLAAYLLTWAMAEWQAEGWDGPWHVMLFDQLIEPTKTPRFSWNIDLAKARRLIEKAIEQRKK